MSEQNQWLPDWRVAEQYKMDDRTMLEWRWEFLRRRADYQRAFAECDRRFSKTTEAHPDLFRMLSEGTPQERFDAGEKLAELAGTTERAEQFGLSGMLNPEKNYDDGDLGLWFERPGWGGVLSLKEGDVGRLYEQGVIIVAFDLKHDIEEQIQKTRQLLADEGRLLGMEPGVRRKYTERWAQYLRVLDARAANVTYAEIGRVILGLAEAGYDEQAAAGKQKHTDAVNLQAKITS